MTPVRTAAQIEAQERALVAYVMRGAAGLIALHAILSHMPPPEDGRSAVDLALIAADALVARLGPVPPTPR